MTSAGTYLYCVTYAQALADAPKPVRALRVGTRTMTVRTVQAADLAAVVSDAWASHYDITRANLLAHERVIEDMMSRTEVLPVRFGTVAASDDAIRRGLLQEHGDLIRSQLECIRGCVELGLMVLWARDRVFGEIVREHAPIRRLRDAIATKPAGATYFDRITLGQATAEAIAAASEREAETVLEALAPLARETRVNAPLSDMMALNAAFLVARADMAAFDARVEALGRSHAGRLTFKYAGPLPPYNFVDLAFELEG